MRVSSWLYALVFGIVSLGLAFGQEADEPASKKGVAPDLKGDERVWGMILYAHSGPDAAADADEAKKAQFHSEPLKRVMDKVGLALPKYKNFKILGAHDQKVLKEYATWITPSTEFFLEVDSKGRAREGDGINVYLQFWSKPADGDRQGKVLVKTDAVLKKGSPLIIEGPKWRKGNIVFVLVLEYTELLKKKP